MNNPNVDCGGARRAAVSGGMAQTAGWAAGKTDCRRRSWLLGKAFLLILMFVLGGCGEVVWFPDYVRLPTTPDDFSFPAKTGTALNQQVTSDPITVAGLTAESSTISIIGSSGKYSINGAAATAAAGTVKNGDKVTVSHTSATVVNSSTVSTLTIGDRSASFVSTTRTVDIQAGGSFSAPVQEPPFVTSFANFVSTANAHTISIKDTGNSTSAAYSIGDAKGNVTTYTNEQRTIVFFTDQRIHVRNLPGTGTTTLTIDGVDFVALTSP